MSTPDVETAVRCAWCARALPAPAEQLTVVYGPDGAALTTCSGRCLAGLVADLAGRATPADRAVAGRMN